MDQTVDDICQPFGFNRLLQHLIEVAQNRHCPVAAGIIWIIQCAVLMGDAFQSIGADHGVIQKLTFLVIHVRNEKAEKDVQPLDFCRQ